MDAKRLKLLLCGKQVSADNRLINSLKVKYDIVYTSDFNHIENILKRDTISLILLELSGDREAKLQILKNIKLKYMKLIFLVINNQKSIQNVVEVFNAGASDVFPMPYNVELLVERTEALLK